MSRQALIVIDLQKGLETEDVKLYDLENVLLGVNQRIADFRSQNLPIIFVQHNDEDLPLNSDVWQLFDQLDYQANDYYVDKTHANSFYKTALLELLTQLEVTAIEFCGAQTQYCVDTTIRMAHGLGYELTMKKGLNTTTDNAFLTAAETIRYHEDIWNGRFLTFI